MQDADHKKTKNLMKIAVGRLIYMREGISPMESPFSSLVIGLKTCIIRPAKIERELNRDLHLKKKNLQIGGKNTTREGYPICNNIIQQLYSWSLQIFF